jgi:hypothetical protein
MMISFRMDSRSVVPPYPQIVQQVRQALRMGVLDVGDHGCRDLGGLFIGSKVVGFLVIATLGRPLLGVPGY